jgi:AcrR family transcriptional regulator
MRGKASGLRERKKSKVWEQFATAALEIFTKRGYESTTIEELANAVEISPRTFFRYFQSKEDVVAAWFDKPLDGVPAAMALRPQNEEPFTSLRQVLTGLAGAYDANQKQIAAFGRLAQKTSAIRARKFAKLGQCGDLVSRELAKRVGMDAARDLLPRLMANTAMNIVGAAIDTWVARDGSGSLVEIVSEGFLAFDGSPGLASRGTVASTERRRRKL